MMPFRLLPILLLAAVAGIYTPVVAQEKPRVLVLTDIENEPDDAQSMVRFLTYKGVTKIDDQIYSKGRGGGLINPSEQAKIKL